MIAHGQSAGQSQGEDPASRRGTLDVNHRYRARAPNMAFSPKTSAVVAWCQTSGSVPKSPAASRPAAAVAVHSWTVAQSRPAAAAMDTAESRFTRQAMDGPRGRAANSRASKAKTG